MEKSGLVNNILDATISIDFGRKGFATRGKAEEGRILYEEGIALAMSTFTEAQASTDPQTIVLIEFTFLVQELQLCPKTDKHSINSLTQAIQSFDDAFLVLEVVEDKTLYQAVDKAIPHHQKFRIKGYPKDSFHIACGSHKTRIKNILTSPGIDPIEKALLEQRQASLTTAQDSYIDKQRKVMDEKSH